MKQTMKKQNSQSTVVRLFSQLKGQHIRLTVVAVSIMIYIGLSIYNPMYSALVIDHLWQSIQAAWNNGTPFSITWTNMGRELTQLTIQYFFTWIFYYLQSYLMANVAENLNLELRNQIAREQAAEKNRAANQKADFLTNCVNPLIRLLTRLANVVIAIIAGRAMLNGTMTVGVVQAFFQYVNQTAEPLTEASFMINSLQSALASAKRTFELLDDEEEIPDPFKPAVLEHAKGNIAFEHVSFGYQSDHLLMKNISFEAKPGQKIAVVGSTGAGKTTLVNLLMRFYEVNSGKICVDGVDASKMSRSGLRKNFGMVLQDTWLFSGTVAENIAYSKPDATREEIIAAAKAAKVDYFIRTMPQGYDTMLDNEAANLSAGQRQLITIARVFLCNPPIIILDEATSSVDTRTEVEIGKAMKKLMKGRTSFVIAHRLSTIRDADTILFMEHGNIIEQGNHKELLAKKGAYAALYYSQFE